MVFMTMSDGSGGRRRRSRASAGRARVTVRDVAEAAGVSTATVTRALQGHPAVRDETRSKVEAAARRLDYRPDHIARALVTRTSSTVGMLIPSSVDSFWGEVAAGIEEVASEANYSVLFANSHSEPERERRMIEVFLAQRVAGIIIAGAAGESASWFCGEEPDVPVIVNWDAAFPARFVTIVRTGSPQRVLEAVRAATETEPSFSQVVFDDLGAAKEVVRHLVSLGGSPSSAPSRSGHRSFGSSGSAVRFSRRDCLPERSCRRPGVPRGGSRPRRISWLRRPTTPRPRSWRTTTPPRSV